ncbi:MAG: substrate-binding domain-containing protein [Clostridia bacterium]|nr:substrate-binding domain-containing protein [Clostridia bacterium]
MRLRRMALLALAWLLTGMCALAETPVLIDQMDDYRQTVCDSLGEAGLSECRWLVADGDEQAQRRQFDEVLAQHPGVILLNPVSTEDVSDMLRLAAEQGVPVVLFNREPQDLSVLTACGDRAVYVGTRTEQAGALQGEAIAKLVDEHPEYDRNGDGVIQYVVLVGEVGNRDAEGRTQGCLATLAELGVAMEPAAEDCVCDWDGWKAQQAVQQLLTDGAYVEMIISNNDTMAVGAVEALNDFGVNFVGGAYYLPVVGVDATDAAVDLIESGKMTATVRQDAEGMARAIAAIAQGMERDGLTAMEAIRRAGYEAEDSAPVVRLDYLPYEP